MGSGGRGRRFWSIEEKRQIVAESCADGVSVSEVARRHDVNANLLFTWRRDPRLGGGPASPVLLPVEVRADDEPDHGSMGREDDGAFAHLPAGTEVVVRGIRVRFAEAVPVATVARLASALRGAA